MSNIYFDIINELYSGTLSVPFGNTLLFSILLSCLINLLSFLIAGFSLYSISRYTNQLLNFLIGLFFTYSLSLMLKYLVITSIGIEGQVLGSIALYSIHLVPLYSIIYFFILSHIDVSSFKLLESYQIPFKRVFLYLCKNMLWTIVLFTIFATVFILFDDTKDKFQGRLFFSFQDIVRKFSYESYNDLNRYYIFSAQLLPVLLSIFPALLILILRRKALSRKLSTTIGSKISFSTITTRVVDYFKSSILKFGKSSKRSFYSSFLSLIPLVVWVALILTFMLKYLPRTLEGSLAISFFDGSYLVEVGGVLMNNIYVGILVFIATLVIHQIKYLSSTLVLTFFVLSLIPQSLIGYTVSALFSERYMIFGINLELFISYLLCFGVFPLYFLNLNRSENESMFRLAKSYQLSLVKRGKFYQEIIRNPFNLGLTLVAILILNDYMIVDSIGIPEEEISSLAHQVSSKIKNNATSITDNVVMLRDAFFLLFFNILVILLAPLIYGISREFGFIPILSRIIRSIR